MTPPVATIAVTIRLERSNIRIAPSFALSPGMGYGAVTRCPTCCAYFQIAPEPNSLWRGFQSFVGFNASIGTSAKLALDRVDLDDVAVPQQRDRPAHRRLRPDMADAEAAGRARRTARR